MTQKISNAISGPMLDIIFKAVVILVVPWGIWVTGTIFECKSFMSRGDRFTTTDASIMYRQIDSRLDDLPPKHVVDSLRQVELDITKTKDLLQQFEREFSKNFVRKDELNR